MTGTVMLSPSKNCCRELIEISFPANSSHISVMIYYLILRSQSLNYKQDAGFDSENI